MTPTPRQAAILTWLRRVKSHAGDMYESALWIAADERIPCRGRMMAHAYREICSMLMNEYGSNSREVLRDVLNDFAAEYRKLGISFDTPAGSSPEPDSATTPVPHSFLRVAEAVVRSHSEIETARERARAVFEHLAGNRPTQPDVAPIANRWFEMSRQFPGWAHDRTTPDAALLDGPFKREVEFFEESLLALAQSAVSNLDVLDEILEDANS